MADNLTSKSHTATPNSDGVNPVVASLMERLSRMEENQRKMSTDVANISVETAAIRGELDILKDRKMRSTKKRFGNDVREEKLNKVDMSLANVGMGIAALQENMHHLLEDDRMYYHKGHWPAHKSSGGIGKRKIQGEEGTHRTGERTGKGSAKARKATGGIVQGPWPRSEECSSEETDMD
jgi:hypothetical protein